MVASTLRLEIQITAPLTDRAAFKTSGAADVNQILYDTQVSSPNGLPDMTESIATSMTNLIRNMRGQNGSQPLGPQAIGIATKLDTYVHVRWPWICVPTILVVASLSFVLLTISITKNMQIQYLKSSGLVC